MYPPRVKMTVDMKDPDTTIKLPVTIEGCSGNSQLDMELIFPLMGMSLSTYERDRYAYEFAQLHSFPILGQFRFGI